MNYWHIQLHPDDYLTTETLIAILKTKQVIGLGEAWKDKNGNEISDPETFRNDMQVNDIVMVRNTIAPVALVKVIGNAYVEKVTDEDFDWFSLRRKIEIIDLFGDDEKSLLDKILQKYGKNHIQAPGTLTKCQGNNATNKFIKLWYKKAVIKNIMENIKMPEERQKQIQVLWDKFKSDRTKEKIQTEKEIAEILAQWKVYREKIVNDTFALEDYTNILVNASELPGGYLCNFLERTSSKTFGSSKPGSADNFEVKLNGDNSSYFIKSLKKDKADKGEAEAYFTSKIKPLLKNIVTSEELSEKIRLIDTAEYSANQILMKLAVLDNLTDFLSVYSDIVINSLFDEFLDGSDAGVLEKNHQLFIAAKSILDIKDDNEVELVHLAWFFWEYSKAKAIADEHTPNAILYGPPGTGKTYAVKKSLDFICQGDRSRYEFVQFHPSFAYEDFIEGIKPKGITETGNIRFELTDGIFKSFCKRAKARPKEKFYFVVDEINRANLSSVFGEALLCLEKDYRHDPEKNEESTLIKTQYAALTEQMIREDDKKQSLAYHYENGNAYFGIPKNLFFIGMMNDVDKSIDAFDLALRRRFKWIRKDCDYEVIDKEIKYKNGSDFTNIDVYSKACLNLNNYISQELGLGKSYEFGHSFFMKISTVAFRKNITVKDIENLFILHLSPTLKEYLRSMFSESELDGNLDKALRKFTAPFNSK